MRYNAYNWKLNLTADGRRHLSGRRGRPKTPSPPGRWGHGCQAKCRESTFLIAKRLRVSSEQVVRMKDSCSRMRKSLVEWLFYPFNF